MKVRSGFLSYIFATLLIFGGMGEAKSQPSQSSSIAGFSLTIRAFNSQVALGSDVTIAIRVTNVSTSPIALLFGGYGSRAIGFHYDVRDARGNPLKQAPHSGDMRPTRPPGSEIRGEVLPGKSIEEATTLSDIFQFEKPGKYTIRVSRKESGMPIVRSNVIVITILPKSESSSPNSGL